jgi:hypothetical protein
MQICFEHCKEGIAGVWHMYTHTFTSAHRAGVVEEPFQLSGEIRADQRALFTIGLTIDFNILATFYNQLDQMLFCHTA